jgi:hypothetical protein
VPVVERIGDRLAGLAEHCDVPLRLDLPDTPVIAEVDARRVERILRNLIGNAVEHGEKRLVLVTLAMDDSSVAVTVRDHGIGLKTGEEKLVSLRRADFTARQTGVRARAAISPKTPSRTAAGWRGAPRGLPAPADRPVGRATGSSPHASAGADDARGRVWLLALPEPLPPTRLRHRPTLTRACVR